MRPENFKIILWDFDGVIIDSNLIREQGFIEVLQDYPREQVNLLLAYHNVNGGLSRYVKFRYFFEKIRNEFISEERVNDFSARFSSIMKERLVNNELLINSTVNFIQEQFEVSKEMHIVSGSDGSELKQLCKALKIDHYFVSINGSPTHKNQLVQDVIKSSKLDHSEFCLIGDSENDYEAAVINNVVFFGYNNPALEVYGNYLNKIQ